MTCCVVSAFTVIIFMVFASGLNYLRINPEELRLYANTTGSVTISCSLSGDTSATSASSLRISRTRPAPHTGDQLLVVANASGPNAGQAVLLSSSEGGLAANTATVTGSTAEKSVSLTLTQADCQDAGLYRCNIPYSTSTGPNELNNYQNLTTIVLPGNITISVSPNSGPYTIGSSVTISCNAVIGNYESGQKWTWYYNDNMTGWQQYTEEKDIVNNAPVPVAGSCQYYRQTSHLNRTMSRDDEGRYYRCKVERNYDNEMSETILIEKVEDAVTSTVTTTNKAESFSDHVSSADCFANNIFFIASLSLAVMMHGGF